MEVALRPGRFIRYDDAFEFVQGLETVKSAVARVIKIDPRRAVGLVETFIAGCYEKADEIDDSGGSLAMFIDDLFAAWIKARQAAKSDPHETVRLLLNWWEDDDWGYCHDIEQTAVKSLNRQGLKAFAEIALEQFTNERAELEKREDGAKDHSASYKYRWLSGVLRAIYAEQRDAGRYLAIAEEIGLTPKDCEALAEIHKKRKKLERALKWVERGLELEKEKSWSNGSSWGLAEKKRELLKQLGRGDEALESAWCAFEKHPSKYSYETLMEYVPRGGKSEWRDKVLKVTESAGLSDAVGLYIELKEWDRLAELVRKAKAAALEDLSHYTTEPAAKKLTKPHPDAAAKLFQAMALRILNAKKSKYYDAALENLDSAWKCFDKAGLQKQWDTLVVAIKSEHRRKTSFMPGFEALLEHGSRPKLQSFLDRARKRRARQFRIS